MLALVFWKYALNVYSLQVKIKLINNGYTLEQLLKVSELILLHPLQGKNCLQKMSQVSITNLIISITHSMLNVQCSMMASANSNQGKRHS
jgi:hypothetical protein